MDMCQVVSKKDQIVWQEGQKLKSVDKNWKREVECNSKVQTTDPQIL